MGLTAAVMGPLDERILKVESVESIGRMGDSEDCLLNDLISP